MTKAIVFAASLAAILLLALVARWLKLGGTDAALGSEEAACHAAEDALPGFAARAALMSR